MVDLVKIRKKAREQKDAESAGQSSSGTSASPESSSEEPGAPEPRRKKSPRPKRKSATASEGGESPATDTAASVALPETPPVPRPPAASSSVSGGESKLDRFKRTAGVMEQEHQAVDSAEEAGDEQLELITFSLAGEQYAMEVGRLVEILVPRPSTRVPNADETVIGIISLRGNIVTLLDLRKMLGHAGAAESTDDTRIIVVQKDEEQLGFIVDRVQRVLKVMPDAIEAPPIVSSTEQNEAVKGVFVTGDTITIYLDLDRFAG